MQTQNVRALSTINKQIPEVKKLMDSVNNLPWNLRVPLIVQTLGLGYSIDSRLLDKDQVLPRGSLGRKMGFGSLGEVISSELSQGGLGVSWDSWVNDVKAYQYKKVFGIYFDSRDEVLSEYNSVSEALGHKPVTLSEYVKARDEIVRRQFAKRENELLNNNKNLESRAKDAEFERIRVEEKYTNTIDELHRLKGTLEETKSEYEGKLRLLEAENEKEISEAQEEARKKTAKRYYGKIKHLKSEIETLVYAVNKIKKQKQSLEGERAQLSTAVEDLNNDLRVVNVELKTAEETIARQEEIISRYEQTIDELSERVDQVSTETGIIALEEALDKSKAKVVRLTERLRAEKKDSMALHARLSTTRRKISTMKVDLRNKRHEIKKKDQAIKQKERSLVAHRQLRNFLVFTTLSSLGLLSVVSYLLA